MSQTVTIPSCMNPFEVTINNHTYSFKSGESVELPDEVAEVINHHVDSVPKPLEKEEEVPGGGSSIDIQPLNVTENGTYTAPEGTAYSPVEVNVASSGGGENKLAQLVEDAENIQLTEADLQGVRKIRNHAFRSCTGLTSVTIPNSVTSIGDSAFRYCTGLTSVTIPNSVTSIGSYAFSECTGLTSMTIPDSVTKIDAYVFNKCTSLVSITIPDSVTSMGTYVFAESALTSVTIGRGLATIPANAFYNCTKLTDVIIPNNVTKIDANAFSNCKGLVNITIPNSVTSIGSGSFINCYALKHVKMLATTPPTISSTSFEAVPSDCVIEVPAASVEAYKAATNWSKHASKIVASEEF